MRAATAGTITLLQRFEMTPQKLKIGDFEYETKGKPLMGGKAPQGTAADRHASETAKYKCSPLPKNY